MPKIVYGGEDRNTPSMLDIDDIEEKEKSIAKKGSKELVTKVLHDEDKRAAETLRKLKAELAEEDDERKRQILLQKIKQAQVPKKSPSGVSLAR